MPTRRALPCTSPLRLVVAQLVALAALPGCSGGGGETEDPSATATTTEGATGTTAEETTGEALRPNWHEDVAPVVAERCGACHVDGGIAPFSMSTYEETKDWAPIMAYEVGQGLMPPWHAVETDACQPPLGFKHDARLDDATKALFREWSDHGAPEGDPALAAPIPPPPSIDLPNPTKTVTMASPVTVEKEGATLDYFNCVRIDPGNTSDVYLDGIQLIPGNRAIVHHVLIYADTKAESDGWGPSGIKKDCGGGSGLKSSAPLISGWVPGGLPMETPKDVGIALPAGSRLVLNVHYHATGGGPEIDDGTGVALRWTETPPAWVSNFKLLGDPGDGDSLSGPFSIPAGEADHAEDFEWIVSQGGSPFPDSVEVRLWAAAAHMHRVGVDLRMWVEDRDTAASTCLLETPRWDFDWQRVYEYDAAVDQMVRLKAGDKIRIQCRYNNTLANPGVMQALAEVGLTEPIDVSVGETTLDEMCIGAIGVAIKTP
ncbi:MAG: hypothetical protein R3B09_26215 [Nannocystaceae bacterium]